MTIDIAGRRLFNQRIVQSTFERPSQVVSWFGAMQAQDWAGVKWAIALRCHAATETTIEQAIVNKTIIRTWLLRGTLQVVAAADIRWMLALLAPRLLAQSARRRKQLELQDVILARSFEVITSVLQDHKRLTRANLLLALEQAGISIQGQRGYHILRHAGLEGLICFGPMQDKDQTFVLLDDWVPHSKGLEHEEAVTELARGYFSSHGPATLQDFVWWSGLPKAQARAGLDMIQSQLYRVNLDGETYWLPLSDTTPDDMASTAYLLPAYDEYYLGYKIRDAVLGAGYDKNAVSSGGVFRPVVVIDGQIVGTWKQALKKGSVVIDLKPLKAFTEIEYQALLTAANQYGNYLERPVVLAQLN